jgi:hypothetical protein
VSEAKPFVISKWEVWEAYKRVKANQGAAGVDEQSITDFERDLKRNLVILVDSQPRQQWLRQAVEKRAVASGASGLADVRRTKRSQRDWQMKHSVVCSATDKNRADQAVPVLRSVFECCFELC